jgi:fructose-1,6-bisphosphatase/inositol monophosphatase family enzyme
MSGHSSLESDLALARELIALAATIALQELERGLSVERKAGGSLVTNADFEIEKALRESLQRKRPADAVHGEELGLRGSNGKIHAALVDLLNF